MAKDKRYNALKLYISSGEINHFREIFDIIPKTKISIDAGINYTRLTKKINSPDKFSVRDIVLLSDLFDVESERLYKLISTSVDKRTLRKKKSEDDS